MTIWNRECCLLGCHTEHTVHYVAIRCSDKTMLMQVQGRAEQLPEDLEGAAAAPKSQHPCFAELRI